MCVCASLDINGNTVQDGNTRDMVFSVPSLVSFISSFMTLNPGDIIMTGTPEGVGPIKDGDELVCFMGNEERMRLEVRQ